MIAIGNVRPGGVKLYSTASGFGNERVSSKFAEVWNSRAALMAHYDIMAYRDLYAYTTLMAYTISMAYTTFFMALPRLLYGLSTIYTT